MHYRVLEGGAIACSTVFIWSWTAPSNLTANSKPCQPLPSLPENPLATPKQACLQKSSLLKSGIIPEKVFNLDWGSDRPNRPVPELEQVYEDVLGQAQAIAKRDRLPEAISSLGGIPKNSRHYPLAQQFQNDWSQELLQRATQHYQQANLGAALKLLHTIPSSCHHSTRAKKLAAQWYEQAHLLKRVTLARKSGNWNQVIQTLKQLEGKPLYQSSFVQQTLQYATNKQLEPDNTLMQIAFSTAQESSIASVKRPRLTTQATPSIKTVPHQEELEIATEQALEWAQPPRSNTIATKSAQPIIPRQSQPMNKNSMPEPLFPYQVPNPTATKRSISAPAPQPEPKNELFKLEPEIEDGLTIH